MASPKELALCHVIKNGSILLIKGDSGLNDGKWNAPSTEIESGERHDKAAIRAVFQQSGIFANKVINHGTIRIFLNGKVEYDYKIQLYSTKVFSGDLRPNIQGEARWFNTSEIPFYEMWPDNKYWMTLLLEGKKFDADFFLDENNETVVKYQIREKKEIVKKALPLIIVAAVITLLIFGIVSSGILNQKAAAKPVAVLTPPKSTTSTTTTIATTTIPAPQIIPPAPISQSEFTNTTYIYYIYYSGSPPQAETYYAVANGTGISNWKVLVGNPVYLKSAYCSVYSFYTYCTSSINYANSNSSNSTAATATSTKEIRIANPECLALKPSNPNICYNTYYNTTSS